MGVLHLAGNGQPHAAAAGAQVQHATFLHRAQIGNGLLRQHLGIRAGNQHAFGYIQRQAVKLPLADQIRHRLAVQMALHQLAHLFLHHLRHIQPAVPRQLFAGLAGGIAHQFTGLQCGALQAGIVKNLPDIHI